VLLIVAAFRVQSVLTISSKLPFMTNSVITGASEAVAEASVVEKLHGGFE
jgi:uncharacterized membrane protein